MTEVIEDIRRAAREGFGVAWVPQLDGADALTALAVAAQHVPEIELATAVVPAYPRHPIELARQALTVQAASRGRFTLGIGASHRHVVEGGYGFDFKRPAQYMEEYLTVLNAIFKLGGAEFEGKRIRAKADVVVPVTAPPILVAALGPAMLRVAGRLADGTITNMAGPSTIATHIIPRIKEAAAEAGRPTPRIVAAFAISVTRAAGEVRDLIDRQSEAYAALPSYRAMLDVEGAAVPSEIAIVGDEEFVIERISALAKIGVTDLMATIVGHHEDEIAQTRIVLGRFSQSAGRNRARS